MSPPFLSDALETKPTAKESRGGYWSLYRSKSLFNRRYGLRTNFAVYV